MGSEMCIRDRYNTYNSEARNMILYFLNMHFPDPEKLITPACPLETDTDLKKMQELLDLLEQKPDIPRNTYVLAAKDAGKIIELGQETGTYLEQLIENSSLMEKEAYPTIGTLYAEQENRVETLFLPYVELRDSLPVITGYYAWVRGEAAGRVDAATALLSAFTAGNVESYTLQLGQSDFIRLVKI